MGVSIHIQTVSQASCTDGGKQQCHLPISTLPRRCISQRDTTTMLSKTHTRVYTSSARPTAASRLRVRVVKVACAASADELRAARSDIEALIRSTNCNPILIRLGWHDAGTYDKVRGCSTPEQALASPALINIRAESRASVKQHST